MILKLDQFVRNHPPLTRALGAKLNAIQVHSLSSILSRIHTNAQAQDMLPAHDQAQSFVPEKALLPAQSFTLAQY